MKQLLVALSASIVLWAQVQFFGSYSTAFDSLPPATSSDAAPLSDHFVGCPYRKVLQSYKPDMNSLSKTEFRIQYDCAGRNATQTVQSCVSQTVPVPSSAGIQGIIGTDINCEFSSGIQS